MNQNCLYVRNYNIERSWLWRAVDNFDIDQVLSSENLVQKLGSISLILRCEVGSQDNFPKIWRCDEDSVPTFIAFSSLNIYFTIEKITPNIIKHPKKISISHTRQTNHKNNYKVKVLVISSFASKSDYKLLKIFFHYTQKKNWSVVIVWFNNETKKIILFNCLYRQAKTTHTSFHITY